MGFTSPNDPSYWFLGFLFTFTFVFFPCLVLVYSQSKIIYGRIQVVVLLYGKRYHWVYVEILWNTFVILKNFIVRLNHPPDWLLWFVSVVEFCMTPYLCILLYTGCVVLTSITSTQRDRDEYFSLSRSYRVSVKYLAALKIDIIVGK